MLGLYPVHIWGSDGEVLKDKVELHVLKCKDVPDIAEWIKATCRAQLTSGMLLRILKHTLPPNTGHYSYSYRRKV